MSSMCTVFQTPHYKTNDLLHETDHIVKISTKHILNICTVSMNYTEMKLHVAHYYIFLYLKFVSCEIELSTCESKLTACISA